MQKPRPYNGVVGWIISALAEADAWTDLTLSRVVAQFPYPPARMIRLEDWVALVSHCAVTRGADPVAEAERLALYVRARTEQTGVIPTPARLKENAT